MGDMIAIAGKGGVGKSTFAALLIRSLLKKGGPVLAVDADPNSNLPAMLGMKAETTIGSILEEFQSEKLKIPAGMTKQSWLETRLNRAIIESRGLDLVVMGRPEGQGCYCAANTLLRDFLDRLRPNYQWIVADNEAGMEHLSRRTVGAIDRLVMISDATVKGLRTAANLLALILELKLAVKDKYLVVNCANGLEPRLLEMIANLGINFLGTIPQDKNIIAYDLEEKSLLGLPDDSAAIKASESIVENLANKV